MNYQNAFLGFLATPTSAELSAALGPLLPVWETLIAEIEKPLTNPGRNWASSGKKYGWSLRIQQKQRNIIYLSPSSGCILVTMVLGEKALAVAQQESFAEPVQTAIREAKRYPEGFAIRILVNSDECNAAIQTLMRIKANS